MKRLSSILSILLIISLVIIGRAYPWGTTAGDASSYGQLRETAIFHNNSGGALIAGQAVILQVASTGAGGTAGTTLGTRIGTTATADHVRAIGVVLGDIPIDSPGVVCTKGPVDTLALDSSSPIAEGNFVGTSTTRGKVGRWQDVNGSGAGKLGIALEAGDASDTGKLFIWVNPN